MAAAQRYLTVDLGASSLKLGEFLVDGGKTLTLTNYVVKELGIDPNKTEERFPFILEALGQALAETGIKPGPAVFGVSGQAVFTRFVKLPPVDVAQVQQMIVYEAQQNVPFPIEEVVWDYQLFGANGQGEIEALIVAIKSDVVEESNGAMQRSKIETRKVDVAPLALVNAYRLNYPERADQCSLIIDIGAKSTNLVFVEPSRVFCRVIPIAGHQISQNICNEFQEPHVAAEIMKKGKGFVGLGGAYADPEDQAAARISKIARTVFSRLHAEVARSISFYRNQQNGSAPQHVLLTGGTSLLPYSDVFFKEKLNLPVEIFNPLKTVAAAPQLDRARLAKDLNLIAPLVGMAARFLGECPVEVDLTPGSVRGKTRSDAGKPFLLTGLAAFAVALALPTVANMVVDNRIVSALEAQQAELAELNSLASQIDNGLKEFEKTASLIRNVSRLETQRAFWPVVLNDINTRVPVGIWIVRLEAEDGKGMSIATPVELPPEGPARPGRGLPGTGSAARMLNTAAQAEDIVLTGIVEINRSEAGLAEQDSALQAQQMVEMFRTQLASSPLFAKVETTDFSIQSEDQAGLAFTIRAKLKPEAVLDMKP